MILTPSIVEESLLNIEAAIEERDFEAAESQTNRLNLEFIKYVATAIPSIENFAEIITMANAIKTYHETAEPPKSY